VERTASGKACFVPSISSDACGAGSPGNPQPRCPIRNNEPCGLCLDGVTGPADCGLVWLVMNDAELREGLARRSREQRQLAQVR
jgi:hypothetical protein